MQNGVYIDSSSIATIKKFLAGYARRFDMSIILDSNSHIYARGDYLYKKYDLIAGFANKSDGSEMMTNLKDLTEIDSSLDHWYLGYITYDIKNSIETLQSKNPDHLKWPELLFFKPSILFLIRNNKLEVNYNNRNFILQDFLDEAYSSITILRQVEDFNLKPRMNKEEYLYCAKKIINHIKRGDIYELNYCQEFYNNLTIDPYGTYLSINQHSPSPFSAFLKIDNHFLLSASPERFLKKETAKIISQPIKGTAPRGDNKRKDDLYQNYLRTSTKERAENIMITDLVRNDLSKLALKNSVTVEELCGIYAFPHIYQMISTISATIKPVTFADIIKATFPMGSMTGAPKIKAMQLIENYETVKRGLYSGSVGYIAPGMDFDFNVVIRSLQYDAKKGYLSYMTGSALTALSDMDKEYEECLLKSYAINPDQQSIHYA